MLTPGARLGPYEIVAAIGAGGMGEVYRATDTRLDRTVAIKTITGAFSERFEREARAISALNHPHICTLHDIGHERPASGADEVAFLVMEHVEGTEPKGPLPLDQAIGHAVQICEALEAAHKAGIVHRDLKPANILITRQGVKLLDFGLAKLQPATMSAPTSDATVAVLTGAHTVLGTPQYMAPEQIEGREADARADIFAFGCVLYELLTGRPAFEGKSPSSVMAAILASEPRPMCELRPVTPPAIERLVATCLAKDPDDRYQSIHDVRLQLEWIRDAGSQPTTAIGRATGLTRERTAWAAALLLVLAGAAGLSLVRPGAVTPALRVAVNLPPGFQLDDSNAALALSPDGQRLALAASGPAASQRLWIRSLTGDEPQPIAGTEGATYPFWSPDGRSLGFFAGQKLKKVDVASGAVQTLCDAPNGRGASWGADGVIVFAPDYQSGLFSVPSSGGSPQPVTHPDAGGTHRMPYFLPDGRHVLFVAGKPDGKPEGIFSLDRPSGKTTLVAPETSEGRYVAGHLVFLRVSNLMAQPFDPASQRTSGSAVVIAENVTGIPDRFTGQYSVSDGGMLVYQPIAGVLSRQLTMFGVDGTKIGEIGDPDSFGAQVFISPDGRKAATLWGDATGRTAIWIYDLATGVPTRLTFGSRQAGAVTWAPDARNLAFSTRDGAIGVVAASGSAQPRIFWSGEGSQKYAVSGWSPDGQTVALLLQSESGLDIAVMAVAGQGKPSPLIDGPGWQQSGTYAPDGRAFAYISNETGSYEVFVMPLPKSGGKLQVTSGGGQHPQWINGGRELAYVTVERKLVAVEMTRSGDQLTVGRSRPLFGGRPLPTLPGAEGDREGTAPVYITPDGARVLLAVPTNLDAVTPLTLVTNWKQ
jgi:eukaryotic-like serine/threonine-protein kinase